MNRTNIANLGRLACRRLATRNLAISSRRRFQIRQIQSPAIKTPFSTSARLASPLTPELLKSAVPLKMTDEEYHAHADAYLETLLEKYEAMADSRNDVDVEFSAGVMNVTVPNGEYVLNKQPPNKQIWLSSPISGPKRYDYVVISEGQDQKQDTAVYAWVYLRDGTTLSELLRKETGVGIHDDEAEDPAAESLA
ncbi:mitochondrial chaperone Frataxin [Xylariomycetidae sp. FL2044]|nr:mitochondrial chaperone Frataxin [Xylariomycetidae sp. FL2044]